jgi:hypothetical protein
MPRKAFDPEALLRAHFQDELEEERIRSGNAAPPRIPVSRITRSRSAWIPEVAAALVILGISLAQAYWQEPAAAALSIASALESGSLGRATSLLGSRIGDAVEAYAELEQLRSGPSRGRLF